MDARTKHLRRLRRLRSSARGWSVRAGLLVGATAVFLPYHGIGLPDAVWAAAACGSVTLATWRWIDLRALGREPVPELPGPEAAAAEARERVASVVRRLPAGQLALDEFGRHRAQARLRGTAVADLWRRLDRASAALTGLRGRLSGPAADAVAEADAAERSLRELAERAASVERAAQVVAGRGQHPLTAASAALLTQLTEGVQAYEQLVAAAAVYVAEDSRTPGPNPAVLGLTDAAELLRCVAESLAELRRTAPSS